MAAQIGQPTRSQRFIKVYLLAWALMAVGALGYLTMLALQPPAGASRPPQVADPEPSQSVRALAKMQDEVGKLRPEIGAVRSRVNDLQNDVGQLKEAMAEQEAKDRTIQSRVSAIEERLATTAEAAQTPPAPGAKAKAADKTADKGTQKTSESRAIAGVITVSPSEGPRPTRVIEAPPMRLETGSIVPPEPITFGEAVVTAATSQTQFAVQLAAGPSLPGLRKNWEQLVERHTALGNLQPRVVPPRADGGPYRLLAGPLPTKAEAERVCTEMGVGRNACFATNYIGQPLL